MRRVVGKTERRSNAMTHHPAHPSLHPCPAPLHRSMTCWSGRVVWVSYGL